MMYLYEGGNAIPDATSVAKQDVEGIVNTAKSSLPPSLLKNVQVHIGSAGFKVESGDIDIMVDAADAVATFKTENDKDPVKAAKVSMKTFFDAKGIPANVNGRNVSIGISYRDAAGLQKIAQVDVMVIEDAAIVAPWHQHGPRGMYDDPGFKGSHNFMLMSSIAKHLGLKFDAFGGKLMRRDDNTVVGRTRQEVAKILLGPKAKEDDLNSVKTMMAALAQDPDREGKLAQARQDVGKGLLTLPEDHLPGTGHWFKKISERLK